MTRAMVAALASVALVFTATPATAVGSATLFAAHPSIATQSTYAGTSINDMAVKGGRLYLGYGDYGANTGPIDIATVDLTTGATGVQGTAPTEAIHAYRTFGGNLIAPWTDPKGCGTCTPVNGGYTTDTGVDVHTFQAEHLYDYTELGTSRFLVGSRAYVGGAAVWQSDNGGPWREVLVENTGAPSASNYDRYYWALTLDGKVYVQAEHTNFKMRVWDGRRWATSRANIDGITAASDIEVFKGRAYFQGSTFNGKAVNASGLGITPIDFYNAGEWLYAVNMAGDLRRTTGNGTWQDMGRVTVPASVRSVAVSGGHVYVGTATGLVYRVTL